MKRILLIMVMLNCISFAQNWTSVKETNIDVSNAHYRGVDIFTNGYGNHIIVTEQDPNTYEIIALKYYNMDVTGTAGTPVTLESSSVVSPSITGNPDVIYVVYRKSSESYIRTKYSTNGGSTWQYISNLNNANATSIESVMSKGKLHVTYTVSNVVYYTYFENNSWIQPQTVSTNETGFNPRIAAWNYGNDDKVYFLYQKSTEAKWREYDVSSNTWGTLYSAVSMDNISYSGLRVDEANIVIYFVWYEQNPQFQYYFAWAVFDLSNTFIRYGNADLNYYNERMYSTLTTNGESHTVFYYEQLASGDYPDIGLWRSTDGASFPTDYFYEYQEHIYDLHHLNLSSASNDVHVIWQDEFGNNNGNNLRYVYDDEVPLAPQNLDVIQNKNNHPYLTWHTNNEPDIYHYNIYKFINDWQYLTSTSNTYYEDTEEEYCTATPPAECEYEHNIYYKITAVDVGDNESDYSNSVVATVVGGAPSKQNSGNSQSQQLMEYSLAQNYPNPFNPTTQITYSLAENSEVSLKVYDMLGTEVTNLVSEPQTAGLHEVHFDAENFASGVYIYRITASKDGNVLFTSSKQMTLLK